MTQNEGRYQQNVLTRWGLCSCSRRRVIVPFPTLHVFTFKHRRIKRLLNGSTFLERSKEATFYSDRVKKATQVEFILIILLGVFTNKHMQEVTMTLSGHWTIFNNRTQGMSTGYKTPERERKEDKVIVTLTYTVHIHTHTHTEPR